MKTFFASLSAMALFASMACAANMPRATQAPEVQKRQSLPGGLDLSQVLANPSSAFAEVSQLLQNPTISALFTSITAQPAFQSSISAALVSEVGSSSAAADLQEFNSAFGGSGSASGSSSSSSSASASQSSSASKAGAADGSVSTFTVTTIGSAISLGAAVFLFAM